MNILKYREHIDTEFKEGHAKVLSIKALKTDAKQDSLKKFLNMQSAKSCDYIRFKGPNKLWMIECSDIESQNERLFNIINLLKSKTCSVDPKLNKKCNKDDMRTITKSFNPEAVIRDELRQKCIETTLLVHKITDHLNICFSKKFNKKVFIIVVKEINYETSILYDVLAIKLRDGLNGIVDDVKVWPQDVLVKKLK